MNPDRLRGIPGGPGLRPKRHLHLHIATATLLAVCLAFGAAASLPQAPAAASRRLLILQSHPEAAFAEAVEGVTSRLRELDPEGALELDVRVFSEMEDPSLELRQAPGEARPVLVITLGAEATRWAQSEIDGVPLLFGMVLDPETQGISPSQARAPMTGVSMQVPLSEQFECLHEVLPDVKRVGTVYDERNQRIIDQAQREARKHGLELTAVPVHDHTEVPEAFGKLAGEVDALWSFPDTTVYSREAAQFILLFSFRHRLPLMGFSRAYVRAGALFGLYADYADVGAQLAEVAHEIITGRSPGRIPIDPPRNPSMALNRRVAEALGAKVAIQMYDRADEVFE